MSLLLLFNPSPSLVTQGISPAMISEIDTIVPTLILVQEAINTFNESSVLYSSSDVTYSDSDAIYGGADPNITRVNVDIGSIDDSPTNFYSIEDI